MNNQGPSSGGELSAVGVSTVDAGGAEQSSNSTSLSGSAEEAPSTSTLEASQDSSSSALEQNGNISPQGSVSRQSSENPQDLGTATACDKTDHRISLPETVSPFAIT